MTSMGRSKILIIRLSSLGDVILSTSVLESLKQEDQCDWLTMSSFYEIIEGHPKVKNIWSFDRQSGLKGWMALAREIYKEDYDVILDLHRSLRSSLLKIVFFLWKIKKRLQGEKKSFQWKSVKKERFKFFAYYLFKRFWPDALRPSLKIKNFLKVLEDPYLRSPNLMHLVSKGETQKVKKILAPFSDQVKVAVMPSSTWSTKNWGVQRFEALIEKLNIFPVILGTSKDQSSLELTSNLNHKNISHINAVGDWSLSEVAYMISQCQYYLGNDTGLAHLSEAVGVPVEVVHGPTTQDCGFGPWKHESRVYGKNLWCRPCSKDGQSCHRIFKRKPKRVFSGRVFGSKKEI